jgi:hypothetical protein
LAIFSHLVIHNPVGTAIPRGQRAGLRNVIFSDGAGVYFNRAARTELANTSPW